MKPEDLMIGDWVNFPIDITGGETEYDSQTIEYQPMQIVSISAWANNDGEVESREGVICDIEQLKPIFLTPEILEKNGFKECTNEDWTNDNVDFILYRRKDGIFRIQNTNMTLPYVSSFQHALRLFWFGKEIEI